MFKKTEIIGVILSGGAGQRFGGQDKGLYELNGQPLVSHVIEALTPQVSHLVICVNRNIDAYADFGLQIIVDETEGFQGPLAGICAAINAHLDDVQCNALLMSSCDSPKLPHDYVEKLIQNIGSAAVSVVHDGQRRQNLHCLIARSAWPSLLDFFARGERAMHRWFSQEQVVNVDFSDQANLFVNFNSPAQIESSNKERA